MFHRSFVLFVVIGLPLCASTFTNGSFETNTCGLGGSSFSGTFTTLPAGDTCITGWTVVDGTTNPGTGTIDYINTHWQAASGAYSIDLDGDTPGGVSQTFDTVTGEMYIVTFDLSGNPDNFFGTNDNPVKTLLVSGPGGAMQTYTYNVATEGNTQTNMKYVPELFSFTATGTSSTLRFQSENVPSSTDGPVIDAVSVRVIPEPGPWLLTGAGLATLIAFRLRMSPDSRTSPGSRT